MSNTIEKAEQKRREAELARQKTAMQGKNDDAVDAAQSINEEKQNSIEKSIVHRESLSTSSSATLNSDVMISKPGSTADAEGVAIVSPSITALDTEDTNSPIMNINLDRLESIGFVSLETSRKQINEEYREIKRKLLRNAFGALSSTLPNSNIIMVTSARPSEGKTFTAVNLAMSIAAEKDKTVLLVDADVLKPNVLRTLGEGERNGLMEYLLGDITSLSDVIYHTNIDKLKIIPAGRSHHLSTELLASTKMNDTVNEFSNRYPDRIVIIDTPPIIGINESAVLANFAGQAVVVVEEGKSKLIDIQKSVERLNPDMAIGFVVNKSLSVGDSTGYYGYGDYGADREEASK